MPIPNPLALEDGLTGRLYHWACWPRHVRDAETSNRPRPLLGAMIYPGHDRLTREHCPQCGGHFGRCPRCEGRRLVPGLRASDHWQPCPQCHGRARDGSPL